MLVNWTCRVMLCKQGITLARLKLCNWGRQSAVGAIINSHCQRTGMTSPGDTTQLSRVKSPLELSTIQQATLNSIAHHSRNHRHAAAPRHYVWPAGCPHKQGCPGHLSLLLPQRHYAKTREHSRSCSTARRSTTPHQCVWG